MKSARRCSRIKVPVARERLIAVATGLRDGSLEPAEAAARIEAVMPLLRRQRHPLARHPPTVHPPMTPEKAVLARRLKSRGLTNTEIALTLDCNEGRVSEAIHDLR